MGKPIIDAKQAVEDIRSGLDDAELMRKYNLSAKGLESLIRKLVAAGVLSQQERAARMPNHSPTVALDLRSYRHLIENKSLAPEPPRPARVGLAISDDDFISHQIKEIVEKDDLETVCLKEGLPSIDRIRQIAPDLVIADTRSARFNNEELIARVGEADPTAAIVLLTAPDKRDEAFRSVEQGAYGFVEIPPHPQALNQTMGRALEYTHLKRFRRDHARIMEEAIHQKTVEIVRTKDFLKGMLNSSSLVSVILTDLDQKVLFWNKGAEHIFGYSSDEIVGNSITKLYPADAIAKETVDQLRSMIKAKQGTVLGKMKQLARDGRVLTMSLALSPMLDQAGNVEGILGIGLDVTEEERQQKEILNLLVQMKKTQDVSIFALAKLAESRDEETGLHLIRIQKYCEALGDALSTKGRFKDRVSAKFIEDLCQSCVLHDIGKVAIPDSVLMSSEAFSDQDREIMKRHPIVGGQALEEAVKILGEQSFLTIGMDVAYYHHERWDGKGYPFGLHGESVPLSARIVALADVYDALTSERRYKRAFSHEEAMKIILEGKGKHFDPHIVEAFEEIERLFRTIRSTHAQ